MTAIVQGYVIAASEVEDDGKVIGVDVVIRLTYDDNDDEDISALCGRVGAGTTGLVVEDGRGTSVLSHAGGADVVTTEGN